MENTRLSSNAGYATFTIQNMEKCIGEAETREDVGNDTVQYVYYVEAVIFREMVEESRLLKME